MGMQAEQCRIMVRVYANVLGLSKALARAGLMGHEARSMSPFTSSFTRAQELFDYVDAAEKKEGSDFKIRGNDQSNIDSLVIVLICVLQSKKCSASSQISTNADIFILLAVTTLDTAHCSRHIEAEVTVSLSSKPLVSIVNSRPWTCLSGNCLRFLCLLL